MTRQRTSKRLGGVSWSDRQLRQHSAAALRYAMTEELASQADVAKWSKKSVRAVREQLSGRRLLTLDVLRSGRLRRHLLRYLSVCDQRVRKTLPHVLRAKRARK